MKGGMYMSSEMKMLLGIIGFLALLVACRFAVYMRSFMKEWRYINSELYRCSSSERPRWKRARKRLLLSLIPFYNPRRKKKKKSHH